MKNLREVCRVNKIPLKAVADFGNWSYGSVTSWINGYAPCPPEVERAVMELAAAKSTPGVRMIGTSNAVERIASIQ